MAVIIRMSVMSNLALSHCFRNDKVLHIVNCDRHNYSIIKYLTWVKIEEYQEVLTWSRYKKGLFAFLVPEFVLLCTHSKSTQYRDGNKLALSFI